MSPAVESVGAPGSTNPLPVEPDHGGAQAGPLGPSTPRPGDVVDFPPYDHPNGPYGGCRALLVNSDNDWLILCDDNGDTGHLATLTPEPGCTLVRHDPKAAMAARILVAADNTRIAAQTAQAVA